MADPTPPPSSTAASTEYPFWSADRARRVLAHLVVEAGFTLTRSAHIGSGRGDDDDADAPVLIDPVDGSPLLPGDGLGGALRRYLRTREGGYPWQPGGTRSATAHHDLLGDDRDEAMQLLYARPSPLVIDEAPGTLPEGATGPETRASTAIDAALRARADGSLREMEAWPAGTTFAFRFELVLTEREDEPALRRALATALYGLHTGEVRIGGKTRRGYGTGVLANVRARRYGITEKPTATSDPLLDWLRHGNDELKGEEADKAGSAEDVLAWLLGKEAFDEKDLLPDRRLRAVLHAEVRPVGTLLFGGGEAGPADEALFQAAHGAAGEVLPVARGTGLAGPLRARALRLAHAIHSDADANTWIDRLWGYADEKDPDSPATQASRVRVDEAAIRHGRTDHVHARIAIDPFLGGAADTALFQEQPLVAKDADDEQPETCLPLDVEIEGPCARDVGLLLHLLRDVWTQDLAFGKGEGVGRGRMDGRKAELTLHDGRGGARTYAFSCTGRTATDWPFHTAFDLSVEGPPADPHGAALDAYDHAFRCTSAP